MSLRGESVLRVLLVANRTKDLTADALQQASAWLGAKGIQHVSTTSEDFEERDPDFLAFKEDIASFDLVCCFGGDGTVLRTAHLIGTAGIPLLSCNFGTLGFLTGAAGDELIPALEAAVSGQVTYERRVMLTTTVHYTTGQQAEHFGLNELAVSRGNFGRIVALDLFINDCFIDTIRGDGVLVSTPTGSTAYALSAGGPFISPTHEGLCIVPIAPHKLSSRAIVTAATDRIRLVPNALNKQSLVIFIDGEAADQQVDARLEVKGINVRPSEAGLLLVRYGEHDFYKRIANTFFRSGNA